MNIEINDTEDHGKEIIVTAPWEAVAGDWDDILSRYSRIPLKGFRSGKAPLGAIEAAFRNEIRDDFASQCAKRICRGAMNDAGIEAATPLELDGVGVEKGESLSFRASFIPSPEFDLPDYNHLGIQCEGDEALDEISARLLETTHIDLPPVLIKREQDYSGDEAEEQAAQRVKLMLILKKIASREGLEADDRDVKDRIRQLARENGVGEKELTSYLGNAGIGRLADMLLAEKVLDFLVDIQEPAGK